jgi:hypothetical protein
METQAQVTQAQANNTTTIRITSKALKHPETGKTLRANFEPVDVTATLPTFATGNEKLDKVLTAIYADAVKAEAQKMERAAWIAGEQPFNPANPAEVKAYFQKLINSVDVETLYNTYFGERTRNGGFTVKQWKQWITNTFIKALNLYYSSQGKPVLDGPKLLATIALLGQGRNMAEHNRAAFVSRFSDMLESDNADVLELLTTDESQAAFNWLTQADKVADIGELEI